MPKSPEETPTSGTESPDSYGYIGTTNLAIQTPAEPTQFLKDVARYADAVDELSHLGAYGRVAAGMARLSLRLGRQVTFLEWYGTDVFPGEKE